MSSHCTDAVVVNYNAGHTLALCWEALRDVAVVERIVISDNDSRDGSLGLLPVSEPTVGVTHRTIILENHANLGFGQACNLGYSLTQSPYVLFINPDCIVQPGSVERLVQVLQYHPDMGMVGPLILNPDGSEQAGARRNTPTLGRAFITAFGLSRFASRFSGRSSDFNLDSTVLPTEPSDVDAISGACMLVRRSAIQQVGLFDEGYFMHCEDLDWCMRFRLAGWRVVFVPDSVVMHEKGVSSRSRPIFVEWHKHKGMARYYRKFFADRYSILLMPCVLAGIWVRFSLVALAHLARRVLAGLGLRRA